MEFYEIFKRLEFESNGISSDKINPRLIACLLRLGDLLDVDDARFNLFTEKVFQLPKSSESHKVKHSSIKHILITPEAIEITSDCPNEEVYRLARSWFDWLEEEVEKQSKEWSNIAPTDLGGSSPTIPKGKIKVYYNNKEIDDRLLNLRFQVSNKKIFEILEGSSIYDKAEFTFIRELVQNALDASKIQLWKEIEKGTFDFAFREHFKEKAKLSSKFLDDVIPIAIRIAETTFLKNYQELKNNFKTSQLELSYSYFKLLLTKQINEVDGENIQEAILGDYKLDPELVEKLTGESVKMNEFFSFKRVIVPAFRPSGIFEPPSLKDRKKRLIDQEFKKEIDENILVFWNTRFFSYYLLTRFKIQEVYFVDEGSILVLDISQEKVEIKKGYEKYLERFINTPYRAWNYTIDKYDSTLSVENIYASGFEHFPYLSNRSIISPFKDNKEFEELKERVDNSNISLIINDDLVKKLVSSNLIQWIKDYKPKNYDERTDEVIINAYKDLIIEIFEKYVFK